MSAAGMPVISATARPETQPHAPLALRSRACIFDVVVIDKSFLMITFIMPSANAASVPGL